MNTPPALLVAHQGGWDELLIIVIPLALYGALRVWERLRGPDEEEEPDGADGDGDDVAGDRGAGDRDSDR